MDGGSGEWVPVIAIGELPEGRSTRVQAFGIDIFIVRSGERIFALATRCTHQGAPLDRGIVKPEGTVPTVTCPAHGSMFSLQDGSVRRGPATQPVAAFDARVSAATVELRPRS